nr:GNAT family N-acetyltransferase [Chloroflexia bacterium]
MTFLVRLATERDISDISRLIPLSVRALSAGVYTDRQIESALTWIYGVDRQLIADGSYYVATSGTHVVGCGGWSKRAALYQGDQAGYDHAEFDPARSPARVRAFYVHPGWARRVIGRRIMERCEADARRAGFRQLELAATIPGEPLYAAMGYVVTARAAAAMPNGESLPFAHMTRALQTHAPTE